ncbi:MAG: hypothetical protein ACD_71C00222G0010 [uncultured bacterium (gcode 4)]|uniref:Uncharacterized protein n=1 Tax=uncultured bacterium (gcode 4) TaxID=1234023 RepID=K1Z4K5_9BACT|nr:MAG: hypothetical protein ACD_71C00222G0010 [uncultured bacterium (gcode 4)]
MDEIILKNDDLNRLLEEGYSVWVKDWSLYIHNIPVLNSAGGISTTYIVTPLDLDNGMTMRPAQHIVYIAELPYKQDNGSIILLDTISIAQNQNVNGLILHQLSRKPANGYEDYYQKMTTYINILVENIKHIDSSATGKKWLKSPLTEINGNLLHTDTNASRANIFHLNKLFENQKIAIIGIWGTGSYILDLIARLPLAQIDLFDDDIYANHNFFRSPGSRLPKWNEIKSEVFKEIYSERNENINSYTLKIDESNLSLLDNYDFIFICIDTIDGRKVIIDYLNQKSIYYIDTGIGILLSDKGLYGNIKLCNNISLPNVQLDEDNIIYKQNIQLAEINALAACTAVIEWKKRIWYYWNSSLDKEEITFDFTNIC